MYSLHNSRANGSLESTVTRKANFTFEMCAAFEILLGVNELYIGCPTIYDPKTGSGTIYIIEKKSDGNWVSKTKLTLKGNPPKIDFGHAMCCGIQQITTTI